MSSRCISSFPRDISGHFCPDNLPDILPDTVAGISVIARELQVVCAITHISVLVRSRGIMVSVCCLQVQCAQYNIIIIDSVGLPVIL